MNGALTYLTLGALLARAEKGLRVRAYIVGAAILLVLLIGCSRVFLGVHWPTDVAAGWVVGAAWALLCSLLLGIFQARGAAERPSGQLEAGAGPEPDPDES